MTKGMENRYKAQVHCPICTHTVVADVEQLGKKTRVVPGQRCPRCSATLDVAAIVEVLEAA